MTAETPSWNDRLAATFARYDEALTRAVAGRLVRPRSHWPVEDLVARCLETFTNAVVVDRRVAELDVASRRVLALIGHSRQPVWMLGNLVEMVMALGQEDGLAPVLDLLGTGFLYPVLDTLPPAGRLRSFEQWLGTAGTAGLAVFAPPSVASRSVGTDLGLEVLPTVLGGSPQEADGLEWILRLGAFWQQVAASPLRRTQQGGLFKRDVERIQQDPLLNGPTVEHLAEVPEVGFWLMAMAELEGIAREVDGELRQGSLPASWDQGLWPALESLWAQLFRLRVWSPLDGWRGGEEVVGNPFPSAYLLLFLLLARQPNEAWVAAEVLEAWLLVHHPYWTGESMRPSRQRPWVEAFLLGLAFPMRLVQASRDVEGKALVRLTPFARWLLGVGEMPGPVPTFPKTLMVQPNLEVIAYRQGLTPALVGRLTRFAAWRTLGSACQLQLEPETVYRALELGESFDSLCRVLEQHGTRATPAAVIDSLRTWSNKRDRITIYPAGALLEFNSANDLAEALARGLPAVRISDTLAVVASEDQIEFRHFRLAGTRDYGLPPERCVIVEDDGVTLTVDLVRSDLMLETELPRFAELVERTNTKGTRQYKLTPASLARGRAEGMTLAALETWFQQRVGEPVSAAARLLLTAAELPVPRLERHLVLHVESEEVADGLLQWPETRALIGGRLGPTALAVEEARVAALTAKLEELGVKLA